jgi:hypothetical protein
MTHSGMFALSEPGSLDDALANATLRVVEDDEIEFPIAFDSVDLAARGFVGAGPMALAIGRSGEEAVAAAVQASLRPLTDPDGQVVLPAWFRAVLARAGRTDVA